MKADDIRLTTYDLRATFKIDPEGAVAAAGRGHGDHRHRGRAGRGAAGAVDSRHRAQPVALPRSEGDDHRPVLRTQPARRPAGRAGEEPLRLRPALGRRGDLGHQHAAEAEGRQRQGLRARPRRADRHRPLADASAARSSRGAGCCWLDAEAGSLDAREAADGDDAEEEPIRVPAGPPPEVVFSAPTQDETDVSTGDDRADSVLARHRSGDAEGQDPRAAISGRRARSAASR